jgi:hypothetical protein
MSGCRMWCQDLVGSQRKIAAPVRSVMRYEVQAKDEFVLSGRLLASSARSGQLLREIPHQLLVQSINECQLCALCSQNTTQYSTCC